MQRRNKVIYTCITGKYDVLLQPRAIDESYDYICFVANGCKESFADPGIWQIVELPVLAKSYVLISRLPKALPHAFLSKYDYGSSAKVRGRFVD